MNALTRSFLAVVGLLLSLPLYTCSRKAPAPESEHVYSRPPTPVAQAAARDPAPSGPGEVVSRRKTAFRSTDFCRCRRGSRGHE